MKGIKSMLWAILALVVLGGVYWGTRPDYGPVDRGELVSERPEDIDSLEVTGRDGKTVRLARTDGTWRVAVEGAGGEARWVPADGDLVRQAIDAVVGAQVKDTVSSNRDRYALFGVDEETATLVTARRGDTEVVVVMIGNVDGTGTNTYVRLREQDRVLAVPGRLKTRFNRVADQWRERSVVSLDSGDVGSVRVSSGSTSYTLRRTEKPGWEILEGADGERAEGILPSAAEAFLSTMGNLRARSFATAPIAENAEVALRLEWNLIDGSPGGVLTFLKNPANAEEVLVAGGPGGDTAVLNAADIKGLEALPGDFPRSESEPKSLGESAGTGETTKKDE